MQRKMSYIVHIIKNNYFFGYFVAHNLQTRRCLDMEETITQNEKLNSSLVMDIKDVAKELRIAQSTAYELARNNDFPSFKIGKRILVYRGNFLKWLENQSKKVV